MKRKSASGQRVQPPMVVAGKHVMIPAPGRRIKGVLKNIEGVIESGSSLLRLDINSRRELTKKAKPDK